MTRTYLLEWLDSIVTQNLNPDKSDITALDSLEFNAIIKKAVQETRYIQTQFTIQVFSFHKKKRIKVLVRNYHSALINLWDQLTILNESIHAERDDIKEVITTLFRTLDDLLIFLETRFAQFISLNSRVPCSYLTVSSKKMKLRLDKLRNSLYYNTNEKVLVEIVFNEIYNFTNFKKNRKATFREMLYHKQLIKELESLKSIKNGDLVHTDLVEVLIYMNFNSKLFINFYTQRITMIISEFEQTTDKIGWLLYYYKELNHFTNNEPAAYCPKHRNLKKVLQEWFMQEISFLEKKENLATNVSLPIQKKQSSQPLTVTTRQEKILCQLSTDQMALVLRACHELEILVSKSMNHVFKIIVPFLSTPYKDNLSFDSMRSKAYVAEERDKEIAIEALQKIIRQIREY